MFAAPVQMHIPDGFLSVLVSLVLWAITIGVVAYALRRAGKDLGERQVPMMGVLAAQRVGGRLVCLMPQQVAETCQAEVG